MKVSCYNVRCFLWMLMFFSFWKRIFVFALCICLSNLACFSQSGEAFRHFQYASRCLIWHVSLSLDKHFTFPSGEAFSYLPYASLCQIWHAFLSLEKHFHISSMLLVAKFGMLYVVCASGIMYICTVYIHLHGFLKMCTFLVSSL